MESGKAVKASQFSFENLQANLESSKTRPITKLSSHQNPSPYPFDKSRLGPVPIATNNRSFPSVVPEKLRPWKNSPPINITGLSNEKKPIQPNLKCQTKRLPLRMALPSPLTDKYMQTPQLNQPQPRQMETLDPRPKGFRVRNGTSLGKVFTDSSARTLRSTSRCGRDVSQCDMSINSGDSDIIPERKRNSDLARVRLINMNSYRHTLPLLIIHFEGILGTCLVQLKEEGKDSGNGNAKGGKEKEKDKDDAEVMKFFIRKGVKNELKALYGSFLITVVFPSWEKKYRRVAKHLMNNGFMIDAMYYNAKKEKTKDFLAANDFTLNYNMILDDFRTRNQDKKILLLLPLNLNSKIVKKNFLQDHPHDEERAHATFNSSRVYDEKQFVHFFPKVRASYNNVKIVCVPNFIMTEKNEKPSNLLKSSFTKVSRMISFILNDLLDSFPSDSVHKRDNKDPLSLPLTPIIFNNIETKNDIELSSSKNVDTKPILDTEDQDQENKTVQKSSVGLHGINMRGLIEKLEDVTEKSKKWRKIKQLRKASILNLEQETPQEFNLPYMKQRIIEGIMDAQKQRGLIKGNIMSHFLVGDLFSRNNYLFKFYEKDEFYSRRVHGLIKEISHASADKPEQGKMLDFDDDDDEKDIIDFTPQKQTSLNTEVLFKNGEDDTDAIVLLMIKKQVKMMQLYLGD